MASLHSSVPRIASSLGSVMKSSTLYQKKIDSPLQVLCPSRSSNTLAIGGRDLNVAYEMVINPAGQPDLTLLRAYLPKSKISTSCVAFHPSNASVLTGGFSTGMVCTWNFRTTNKALALEKWDAHPRIVQALCYLESPDRQDGRQVLCTAGAEGALKLWEVPMYSDLDGRSLKFYQEKAPANILSNLRSAGYSSAVRDLCVSGDLLVGATDNGALEMFSPTVQPASSPRSCRLFSKLQVSAQAVYSVRPCLEDPRILATGARDNFIRVYDLRVQGHAEKSRPATEIKTTNSVAAVRWRPGAAGLQVSSCQTVMDNAIYVWDLRRPHISSYVLSSHKDQVQDFYWVDKFHVMSAAKDGYLHVSSLADATVTIEKMRTVNIAFSLRSSCAKPVSHTFSVVADILPPPGESSLSFFASSLRSTRPAFPWRDFLGRFSVGTLEADEPPPTDTQAALHAAVVRVKHTGFGHGGPRWIPSRPSLPESSADSSDGRPPFSAPDSANLSRGSSVADMRRVTSMKQMAELHSLPRPDHLVFAPLDNRHDDPAKDIVLPGQQAVAKLWDEWRRGPPRACLDDLAWVEVSAPIVVAALRRIAAARSNTEAREICSWLAQACKERSRQQMFSLLAWGFGAGEGGRGGNETRMRDFLLQQTLIEALQYAQRRNDVAVCLLVGALIHFRCPPDTAPLVAGTSALERWTLELAELYRRMQRPVLAAELIVGSPWRGVREATLEGTGLFKLHCGGCSTQKEPLTGSTRGKLRRCQKCDRQQDICCVCGKPVFGLWIGCPTCGHGGHLKHIKAWFAKHTECPRGCGHDCRLDSAGTRPARGPAA